MLIDFIISYYNRKTALDCLLYSLIAQTDKEWVAKVMIDDVEYNPETMVKDSRISYITMNKRYNDFGHTPREIGKQESEADYVILTNDDNYYTPNLVMEVKMAIAQHKRIKGVLPGIVYWDMVHSHFNYQYFRTAIGNGQIDMGAFATRTELAKRVPLCSRFEADGIFIEDFKRKFPQEHRVKIDKVLFVHN